MVNENSSLNLTNVTFSGNTAGNGGGMYNNSNTHAQIRNAIFWNNIASMPQDNGGQIANRNGGSAVVANSVVQGGCSRGSTCTNLITTDPKLSTLGNYGGFTPTIPLLRGSSAIDTGDDSVCPATDQRGVTRPFGSHCDIGAYEYDDE